MNEDIAKPSPKVNKSPISRLMYYLYSIKLIIPEKIKPEYVRYEFYTQLSKEESRELCEIAKTYSPEILNNKIIFESDSLCAKNDNQYYNITEIFGQLNVNENIQIGSEQFHITKILAYKQSWIQKYYYEPYNQIMKMITPKQQKEKQINPMIDEIENPEITTHCSILRIISIILIVLIIIIMIVICAFSFYMFQQIDINDHKSAKKLLDGITAVAVLSIAFYLIGLTMKYCRRINYKRAFYIFTLIFLILEIVLCSLLLKKVEYIDKVKGFRYFLLILVIVDLVFYIIELLFVILRRYCLNGYCNEPGSFCCCCQSNYID